MAIQIEANYSKKIGLPAYSSHQFSITVKAEVIDLSQVEAESSKLYSLLQTSVDREIQQQGYVPTASPEETQQANNHQQSGNGYHQRNNGYNNRNWNNRQRNGYRNHNGSSNGFDQEWKCSLKQKELILNIVQENQLDKRQVEQLSQELFSKGVWLLNKLEASGLIDELLRRYSNEGQDQNQPATNGARQ